MGGRDGFTEYAEAAAPRLRRTAFLICGDWHLAEDLTQTALEKLYVAWRRVERTGNPDAYAKRVVLNAYLDRRRLKSFGEVPGVDAQALERVPAVGDESAELRVTLLAALMRLPPRDRAVLVLRYWEDHSADTVADLLGMSPAAVRARSVRALERLRVLLPERDLSLAW
ncbi:SigE family RNA polymerase sigma factor [Embleya sp. NBC_00896]|uniref:SigE family RNA polymerase sigma factor n=1 Tax=Embleya sp. NBC_00896 TaxID=2975961 RepID=UPI003866D820|nr:SigE family RNA polymerase sigma factor [Embleya sp. NBC_00896]